MGDAFASPIAISSSYDSYESYVILIMMMTETIANLGEEFHFR